MAARVSHKHTLCVRRHAPQPSLVFSSICLVLRLSSAMGGTAMGGTAMGGTAMGGTAMGGTAI
jgi:predicted lipid-binding transport protein (Tim44 family)